MTNTAPLASVVYPHDGQVNRDFFAELKILAKRQKEGIDFIVYDEGWGD